MFGIFRKNVQDQSTVMPENTKTTELTDQEPQVSKSVRQAPNYYNSEPYQPILLSGWDRRLMECVNEVNYILKHHASEHLRIYHHYKWGGSVTSQIELVDNGEIKRILDRRERRMQNY